jgi:AraC family transcriptional regulator of adaptative response / DNA-3-methyladenine glycosylase II
MAQVSQAAGFRSVRHMNRVVKEAFAFTPTELRAKRRQPDRLVTDGGLELRVPYRPPLAWDSMLGFLAARAIPGVESVDVEEGIYRRTIEFEGAPAVIEVRDEPAVNALRLRAHLPTLDGVVHLVTDVRRLFDLDADPTVVDAHLARDPDLRRLVRARRGLRVPGTVDPFELGVRAVLGQQVSVKAATNLAGKVAQAWGDPVPGVEALGLTHLFPSPERVAELSGARIGTRIGIPKARAEAIRAFAGALATGELRLDRGSDLVAVRAQLQTLPGFGEWTAQYVAMRACGERDAFPAGDLGIRRGLADGDEKPLSAAEALHRAEAWRPWRAYAALHLWSAA